MPGGRKPLPANVLQLRGTARPDRVPSIRFDPPVGIPEPPAYLGEEGLEEWMRIAPILEKVGVLSLVDANALGGYCAAYEMAVRAKREFDEEGQTLQPPEDADGNVKGIPRRHPSVGTYYEALTLLRSYASELGLTPAARRRVTPSKAKTKGEDEDILD